MCHGGQTLVEAAYLADDALDALRFPTNGVDTQYTYNVRGWPTRIRASDGTTTFLDLGYTYDAAGLVTGLGGQTYAYDDLGRLTKNVGTPWDTLYYTYDAVGNRLRRQHGETQVDYHTLRPTANGGTVEWWTSGCTANYACVDEGSHDGDTTHVAGNAAGQTDLYHLGNLPDMTGKEIEWVEVTAVARHTEPPPDDDDGDCTSGCITSDPGDGTQGATDRPPGGGATIQGTCGGYYFYLRVHGHRSGYKGASRTYGAHSARWTANPATGQAWTAAEVNDLQVGMEVKCVDSTSYEIRVTQVYVTVKVVDPPTTYEYAHDAVNRLTEVTLDGTLHESYAYDGRGNAVQRSVSGGPTWEYAWDDRGLLTEVTRDGVPVVRYLYDPLGRRVRQLGGIGNGGNVVANPGFETDGSWTYYEEDPDYGGGRTTAHAHSGSYSFTVHSAYDRGIATQTTAGIYQDITQTAGAKVRFWLRAECFEGIAGDVWYAELVEADGGTMDNPKTLVSVDAGGCSKGDVLPWTQYEATLTRDDPRIVLRLRNNYHSDQWTRLDLWFDDVESGSAVTTFVHAGDRVVYETGTDGTATRHVQLGGQRVAAVVGSGAPYDVRVYLTDHLGSTRKVLDGGGSVLFAADYDAFGRQFGVTGALEERYRFVGLPFEADTELTGMGARSYLDAAGRFLSADPILGSLSTPQTLNRYTYARNSPLVYVDPGGLWSCGIYSGEACTRWAAWHPWWDAVDPMLGTDVFMGTVGSLPGIDLLGDLYFLGRDLWAGATTGEWDWGSLAVNAGAAALPFVGVGMARLPKVLKRIDAMGDMLDTASHRRHARGLGFANTGELSGEARAFLKDATVSPGFRIFKEGDDIVVLGRRTFNEKDTVLKGVYSLSEDRVRTFHRIRGVEYEIARAAEGGRTWIAVSAGDLVRYLM